LRSTFLPGGAFFTGLSQQTTLTINYHVYVERFPDPSNADLIVLATPSPSFDPSCLELYSKTAINLPTGTMVKNNNAGQWLRNVADTLQEFGVPGMPLVKGAISLFEGFGSAKGSKVKTQKMNEVKNLERKLANVERRLERPRPPPMPSKHVIDRYLSQEKRVMPRLPRAPHKPKPKRVGQRQVKKIFKRGNKKAFNT